MCGSTVFNKTGVTDPSTERLGDEDGDVIGLQDGVAIRTDSSECFDEFALVSFILLNEVAGQRH